MNIRKLRRGFTLLELLMVVAIIAILIALMVPALKSAKDMGNSAACLSNLRQMGSLMAGYESSFTGTIPGNYWYNPGTTWTSWDNYLQALSVAAVPIIQNQTSPIPSNLANEKLFHCPSATLTIGTSSLQYATYACNDSALTNVLTGVPPGNLLFQPAFRRINQMKRPAEIITVGDCNQDYSNNTSWIYWDYEPPCVAGTAPSTLTSNTIIKPGWTYTVGSGSGANTLSNSEPLPVGPPDTGIRYRHGERTPNTSGWANVLMVDGHAESRNTNTIFARNLCVTY